jgi:hypothetical protein
VAELGELSRVHELIDALGRKLDGQPAATQTYRRRRAVVFNVLEYAVELEVLPSNPLTRVRRKRGSGRCRRWTGGWWSTPARRGSC